MAGNRLIADYATKVGTRLGPDIAVEILDHLTEATERRVAAGDPPAEAARGAIAAFGAPEDLATGFHEAGVALPSGFTRMSGQALSVAAVLLAASLVTLGAAQIVELAYGWGPEAELVWGIGALLNAIGIAIATVGAIGVVRRARGVSPTTVIALTLVGTASVGGLATWFLFGWGTALALGFGTVAVTATRSHLPPARSVSLVIVGALTLGAAPWVALAWMPGSAVVENPAVRLVGQVGLAVLVRGLWDMGRWLVSDGASIGSRRVRGSA